MPAKGWRKPPGGDLYPAGYRDPAWDGSEEQFRDIVIPARIKAVEAGLNAAFAGLLPEGMRFEWGPKGER